MLGHLSLTPTVTFLLIAAVQTVGVGVTVPSERDAVAVFALVLVAVALHITAVLREHPELRVSAKGDSAVAWLKDARYLVRSVGTIVIAIALPAAGDTTPIRAGKLALRTLSRHWGHRGRVKERESGGSERVGREAGRGVNIETRKQGAEQTAGP